MGLSQRNEVGLAILRYSAPGIRAIVSSAWLEVLREGRIDVHDPRPHTQGGQDVADVILPPEKEEVRRGGWTTERTLHLREPGHEAVGSPLDLRPVRSRTQRSVPQPASMTVAAVRVQPFGGFTERPVWCSCPLCRGKCPEEARGPFGVCCSEERADHPPVRRAEQMGSCNLLRDRAPQEGRQPAFPGPVVRHRRLRDRFPYGRARSAEPRTRDRARSAHTARTPTSPRSV